MLLPFSMGLKSNHSRTPRLPERICPSSFAYTVVDLEQLYINPWREQTSFTGIPRYIFWKRFVCFCDRILVALFCQHKPSVIVLTILPWPIPQSFPESLNLLLHLQKKRKKKKWRRRHKVHCGGTIAAATCRCHGSMTQQASGRGDCYVLWVPVTQTTSHKEKRSAGPLVNNSAKWIGWLERRLSSAHAHRSNEALLGFS